MTKRAAPRKTQRLAKASKSDLRCSVGSASAKKKWIKLKGFGIESLKIQIHNKKKKRKEGVPHGIYIYYIYTNA